VTQRGQLLIDATQIADLLIDRGQIVVVAGGLQQHLQLRLLIEGGERSQGIKFQSSLNHEEQQREHTIL